MSRVPIAVCGGLAFIAAYVVAVITLPDYIGRIHWSVEAVYWSIVGIVWVFPIRWLMLWSVHRR